jgi:hypothetical protein
MAIICKYCFLFLNLWCILSVNPMTLLVGLIRFFLLILFELYVLHYRFWNVDYVLWRCLSGCSSYHEWTSVVFFSAGLMFLEVCVLIVLIFWWMFLNLICSCFCESSHRRQNPLREALCWSDWECLMLCVYFRLRTIFCFVFQIVLKAWFSASSMM